MQASCFQLHLPDTSSTGRRWAVTAREDACVLVPCRQRCPGQAYTGTTRRFGKATRWPWSSQRCRLAAVQQEGPAQRCTAQQCCPPAVGGPDAGALCRGRHVRSITKKPLLHIKLLCLYGKQRFTIQDVGCVNSSRPLVAGAAMLPTVC